MKPFKLIIDRELVMGKLAREIGRGHDAIYHGTRYPEKVLRSGELRPDITRKISLSRSPEVAAHFALLLDDDWVDEWAPAVLVLNRSTLVQMYRLEPWHYGEADEQEEVIRRRTVRFRKHLLGVIREADLINAIEELKAGDQLVRDGRARVRDLIISERKERSLENARMPARSAARRTNKLQGRPPKARGRIGADDSLAPEPWCQQPFIAASGVDED
jgi:hypothetical protein